MEVLIIPAIGVALILLYMLYLHGYEVGWRECLSNERYLKTHPKFKERMIQIDHMKGDHRKCYHPEHVLFRSDWPI